MNERLVLGSSWSYSGTEEVIGHGLQLVGGKKQMGCDLIESSRGQRERQGIRRGGIVNEAFTRTQLLYLTCGIITLDNPKD